MRWASGCDFSRERRDRRRQENEFSIERIEVITLALEYPEMAYLRMCNVKTVGHFGHCNPQIPDCQDITDTNCD
jgi:hypothetical protein